MPLLVLWFVRGSRGVDEGEVTEARPDILIPEAEATQERGSRRVRRLGHLTQPHRRLRPRCGYSVRRQRKPPPSPICCAGRICSRGAVVSDGGDRAVGVAVVAGVATGIPVRGVPLLTQTSDLPLHRQRAVLGLLLVLRAVAARDDPGTLSCLGSTTPST